MKKILILSNESGGGHKQTAKVLAQALQQNDRSIKTVSLFRDLFLDMDFSAKFFGVSGEDIYNKFILQNEASQLFYKIFFFSIYYSFVVPNRKKFNCRFKVFFEQEKPDMVISVIPILNHEIAAALNQACPFLIVQTDLFEYKEQSWFWRWLVPYGAWFVADKSTYMLSGTRKGYQQALDYNPDTSKVMQLSGSVIDPRFLAPVDMDIEAEREKLGLKPDRLIGLFLYGGHPPKRLFKLAKQLSALGVEAQFIFICGKNESLKARLSQLSTSYVKVVLGYSKDVPHYMRIADFLIGKCGPGVIMESIAVGLPVLLDISNVMPHEEENAPWVVDQGFGLAFKTPEQLHQKIQMLTSAESVKKLKTKVRTFENKAVSEMQALIEKIL